MIHQMTRRMIRMKHSGGRRAAVTLFAAFVGMFVPMAVAPSAEAPSPIAAHSASPPIAGHPARTASLVPAASMPGGPTQSNHVPSPSEFFGVEIGAPGVLISHSKILEYYRLLEERSDRVQIHILGQTTEGRPFYYAVVTSPDNMDRLGELVEMNSKLYDPRGVSADEAERIIRDGKTFVIVNHQIHATEVGASQAAILLAHHLATSDDHEVRAILDNTVVLHVPVHNPDGQEMVTEWLGRWRGTQYQNSSPPFLYQKYVGHDNNRDWYMFTQVETRHSITMQNRYHPQFTLDQHQMGSGASRIFVPPFEDPWEPNVDGALIASNNLIGTYMGQYMTTKGLAGVEWKERYDGWSPARAYYHTHGGVRILTEVASARFADAVEVPFDQLPEEFRRAKWNFPMVWPGGTWSFSDVVDYHYTAAMGALRAATDLREQLLTGMYVAQERSVSPPAGSPYAFLLPPWQTDPPTMAALLEVLRVADVEVHQAQGPFAAGGEQYPAGTYVVKVAQPAGRFAKSVLEIQDYPRIFQYEGGPLDPPYDVTAHTLPLLMNVTVDTVDEPFSADLVEIEQPAPPAGGVRVLVEGVEAPEARTRALLLDPRVNNSYAAAVELAGSGLGRALRPFRAGGRDWPAGTFVLEVPEAEGAALPLLRQADELAERHYLEIIGVTTAPEVPTAYVGAPRVAIYQSYSPSMPEGWFRYVLDQYGIPYDILHYDDIRAGDLLPYGVIFLPPGGGSPRMMVEGRSSDGRPGSQVPPQYAGGIGPEGVAALEEFVEEGGILCTWSSAWNFLTEYMGVDARSVTADLDSADFNIPGSILRVLVDTDNPLGYGMNEESAVLFRSDAAWPVETPGANAVARYPNEDLLLSGWIQGGEYLAEQAAMLEVPRGRGRMVMIGFSPEYRAQAYLTYKLMFNANFYPRSEESS